MIVVSGTSAISNLAQIGQLDILRQLFGDVTIPPAVLIELSRVEEQTQLIEETSWISVVGPSNDSLVLHLLNQLDLGESQAIVLANELSAAYLIMNEYKGRKIAEERSIKVIGILGILTLAKRKGLLNSVGEYMRALSCIGFRLSDELIERVLEVNNEGHG